MNVLTCRKTYLDIPWAHRQHRHDGHCALIHGHNWGITIVFGCHATDDNGFVVDFGKLKYLKTWIDEHLDHACVFSSDDPLIEKLSAIGGPAVWKTYLVPNCSCEGMAEHLHGVFDTMVQKTTHGRAFVISIEVTEDSKNSAMYSISVADRAVPRNGEQSAAMV
jgi:6-pyruvoyltetrahydropterin/6-carboxytetrahydropterin synthase